jgi:hypothetical protein
MLHWFIVSIKNKKSKLTINNSIIVYKFTIFEGTRSKRSKAAMGACSIQCLSTVFIRKKSIHLILSMDNGSSSSRKEKRHNFFKK